MAMKIKKGDRDFSTRKRSLLAELNRASADRQSRIGFGAVFFLPAGTAAFGGESGRQNEVL